MKRNSSALRRGRYSASGHIYHVTFTTINRFRFFEDFSASREFIHVIRAESAHTTTLAFVVMPDHAHWLLQLNSKSLSDTVQTIKSISSRRINILSTRTGTLWQDGFYDQGIRAEDSLVDIARYIIMNPVRAGLVRSVREYPHWDAVWV